MIDTLIDKVDNVEVVRDLIAGILATEIANQQILAPLAEPPQEAADYKLRIFTERSNPWEQWLNVDETTGLSPLVNVWFESETFDPKASDTFERQKAEAQYNIDCYAFAFSEDVVAGGHKPGDREAAFEVQRAVRLVRNILRANINRLLLNGGKNGFIWHTWINSITAFQPESEPGVAVQNVLAMRVVLQVDFNEFSPQPIENILERVNVDVHRTEDGEIVVAADYRYPLS